MIPPVIIKEALRKNIDLIAITDHNATGNIGAVMEAANGTDLCVLPGMELQTQEEVHVLCLFDGLEQAEAWQRSVDSRSANIPNDEEKIGEQYIVDPTGKFIRKEPKMLIANVEMSVEEAVYGVNALGGLVIPAHVERRAYGLLAILGFASPLFEALEISRHTTPEVVREQYPQIKGFPLFQSGDVHYRDGFLGAMEFTIETPCISEIRKAMRGVDGREMRITKHR
jgi:PHP family Zn ribbon phosphoesterase